jgi:2-polyprenyl-6-methoxyphenol hydroxylase-like FAD-dependent oxidoreductase
MAPRTPVLIVGAGPIGLALAGDLAWRGVPSTIVERSDGVVAQPKMDLVQVRTMEFCRRWGLVGEVERAGYNRQHSQAFAWVTALNGGHELGREPGDPCAIEAPPRQSPQKRERCPQNFFDPVLARWVATFPHVTKHLNTELVDFVEREDHVAATVRDTISGIEREIEADLLIGCDGAGSTVREKLGITMTGNPVLTYTTNAIFHAPALRALNHRDEAYRYIFIGPEGTWATIVAIDGRDTYRFSFVGGKDRSQLTERDLRAAIERAVGCTFPLEILSTMPWTRRELTADSYGRGRVYLVGDSAHQLSPTGGFGMNTGIQEAVDLSWKIAARRDGWGGDQLLATYEIERKPIAARNVREAARNLGRMLASRDQRPPPSIFKPGPDGDAARKAYGDWYTQMMSAEWHTLGVQLGFRYSGSPLCIGDGSAEPPDRTDVYVPTSQAGHRAPHVWLDDGRSTLDLFGRGFVLLRLGANAPAVDDLVEAAMRRRMPLTVTDLDQPPVSEAYQKRLVLVRPDGHVCWRGDELPGDALHLIDTVRGALVAAPIH